MSNNLVTKVTACLVDGIGDLEGPDYRITGPLMLALEEEIPVMVEYALAGSEVCVMRDEKGRYYRGGECWRWTRSWRLAAIMPRQDWGSLQTLSPRLCNRLKSCEEVPIRELCNRTTKTFRKINND